MTPALLTAAIVLSGSAGGSFGLLNRHAQHDCASENWRADLPATARAAVAYVDRFHLRFDFEGDETTKAPDVPPTAPPTSGSDTPATDKRHAADIESDLALGREYATQVEKEMTLSKNAAYQSRVKRIGEEIALVANAHAVRVTWGDARLSPFPYQFRVVEGKDVNAFSLPGGFIYIYEGLVEYAETDDELAGVLAHEISHAAFRHVATLRREQSRLEAITLPLILLSIFAGGTDASNVATGGMLLNQAIGSGWSVRAEESADTGGLQYMQLSGYDPVGMLTFMERLAYDDRKRANIDWGIYRTHPPSRERAENLRNGMRAVGIPIARSRVTTSLRAKVTPDAEGGTVSVFFASARVLTFGGPDATTRATTFSREFDVFMDSVPKLYELRSEGGVILGRSRPLVTLTEADAAVRNKPLPQLVREAVQSVKAAIYDLNYRVWDAY